MSRQPQVVIVSAVYPPEPVVSAQMSKDLALHLADAGARVTVICPAPSRPIGTDYAGFKAERAPLVRTEAGVEVARVPSFASPESHMVRRLRESWSFGRHACRYLASLATVPDAVYLNSWPLFSQALVAHYCRKHGIRVVMQVMDVYPEAMLAKLPHTLRPAIQAPLLSLDRWIVRQADHVILISRATLDHYAASRHLPADKVTLIHTWLDGHIFAAMPDRHASARMYGVPAEPFTFLYLGNIGPVAGIETVIRAFHEAQLPDTQLIIAGDGSARESCRALARQLGTEGIHFISDPDAARTPAILSLADVCILPMRKGTGLSSIPSKMMGYCLAGKPVLAAVDEGCETARCIHEAGCGWVVPPEDPRAFAAGLATARAAGAGQRADMGRLGRRYAETQFSKEAGVSRLARLIVPATPASGQQPDRAALVVRRMEPSDAPAVAALHQAALRSHLRGTPGRHLLAAYYCAVAAGNGAAGFVAMSGPDLAGYVCGVWDSAALRRTLLRRHALRLCLWATMAALRSPTWLLTLARGLATRTARAESPQPPPSPDYELRPIAVAPEYRGHGVAPGLAQRLVADARERGFRSIHLRTETDNTRANAFYRKLGFELQGTAEGYNQYRIRTDAP